MSQNIFSACRECRIDYTDYAMHTVVAVMLQHQKLAHILSYACGFVQILVKIGQAVEET